MMCLSGFHQTGQCCAGRVASGNGSAQPRRFAGRAEKRSLTFCLPLLPPAHLWHKKFPSSFSGHKVALCRNQIKFEQKVSHHPEVSGIRAGKLRISI